MNTGSSAETVTLWRPGRTILEYWIPAEDLPEFNSNIIGLIEVTAEYHRAPDGR